MKIFNRSIRIIHRLGAFFLISLAAASTLRAQPSRVVSESDRLFYSAIELVDAGQFEQARELLRDGEQRFPKNSTFPYELAYILYLEKNYAESQRILLRIIDAPDASDRFYQLLGNTYDLLGNSSKAIEIYEQGLEHFPESGPLYLERGIMAAMADDVSTAVGYWEQGIANAPWFSSNYFHAARSYMGSINPGWGLIYGEIFVNLEPNTKRTDYIRGMMFDTWDNVLHVEHKSKDETSAISLGGISIFSAISMSIDPTTERALMPFEMLIQRSLAMAAIPLLLTGNDTLTIAGLHDVRKRFIGDWYRDTAASRYFAIELFERQRKLEELGLFETYDHLIYSTTATAAEADPWLEKNEKKIAVLHEWMSRNPIAADTSVAFSRIRLKGMPIPR